MKNTRPPSSPVRTPYYAANTTQAPRSDPPTARNGAPPGTVASRVQFLQSLQRTGNTGPPPLPPQVPTPSNRRRENSRTGFGRRLTNRFGPPAVQSGQPFEDARTDTSHSFLGLNTPRKSHVEEHGLADNRIRYSRSPGINGTIAPGTLERSQYDAVAPWAGLSRSKSSRSMGRKNNNNDMDGNRSELLAYHNHIVAEATILPRPTQEDDPGIFRRNFKLNEADTLKSEASFATASTIRRQSVRDLFDDYGIERPVGLASSKESSRDAEDTPRPTRPHRFCHLCSWVNSSPSVKCWRCSHRLCSVCDAQSPQPITRKELSLPYSERFSKGKGLENRPARISPREYEAIDIEPVKQTPVRPGPSVIQARQEELLKPQKGSSPPTKFPDFHPELVPTIEPSQALHPPKTVPEVSQKAAPDESRAQVKTSVKDSPFLVADSTAKKQSIALFAFNTGGDHHQSLQHHHEYRLQQQNQQSNHSSSSSSTSFRCERTGCLTTHCEHRAKRYAVSRTKVKDKQYIREETENGYAADTSHVEELHNHTHFHTHSSNPPSHSQSCFSIPQSQVSYRPKHTYDYQQETSRESCIPEFVECSGYPRTGHVRHGSCSGAELAGECQHCVEDCQCTACQSTHHNVRCCTHKDHKAIVHQHHTPRREATLPELHIQPLSAPRKASIPSRPITTVPPRPQSTLVEQLTNRNPAPIIPATQAASTGPFLERVPSKKNPAVKEKRSMSSKGNTRGPSRMKISPPRSRRASTRLSALFQLREKNSVPELTQKLLQHQEELRDSPNDRDEQIQAALLGGVASPARNLEHREEKSEEANKKPASRMRDSRMTSRAVSTDSTKKWRLRLVDKRTSPPCGNDLPLKGHRLDDDMLERREGPTQNHKVMSEARLDTYNDKFTRKKIEMQDRKFMSEAQLNTKNTKKKNVEADFSIERGKLERKDRKVVSEARLYTNTHERSVEEHECSWKRMVLELQSENTLQCNHKQTADMGIMGITIILRFDDSEDIILKAGSWSATGELGLIR